MLILRRRYDRSLCFLEDFDGVRRMLPFYSERSWTRDARFDPFLSKLFKGGVNLDGSYDSLEYGSLANGFIPRGLWRLTSSLT